MINRPFWISYKHSPAPPPPLLTWLEMLFSPITGDNKQYLMTTLNYTARAYTK